jgi:RNA-splicing ligase RtcB
MFEIRGDVDQRAVDQLVRCAESGDVLDAALCADGHVGYSQPIGGVVAYRGQISPSGVGYDIGCGNKAVRTNIHTGPMHYGDVAKIMDEIASRISFGMGRVNDEPVDHPVLDAIADAPFAPQRALAQLARNQLGTVGSGNHYVDLFEDEQGWLWVGVHFGSRGFGHKTASGFLAMAHEEARRRRVAVAAEAKGQCAPPRGPIESYFSKQAHDGEMDSPPILFSTDSDLGQSYIEAMTLAGDYAHAGRDMVIEKVLEILQAEARESIHNHHNYCVAADQIVPTTDGPKRMDDIVEGDRVYAFSDAGPTPTRVVAHWHSGEKPIYTLSLGTRRLRCSGQHPIMVLDGGTTTWRNAECLAVGDICVCSDSYYPGSRSWGVARARLVGAFLGDGWIRHDHVEQRGYTVGLAIGTGAEPHTQRYLTLATEMLPNAGWGKGWTVDAPGHFGLSCSSKSAHTAAVAMGVTDRAAAKRVPAEAFSLRRDEKLALLAGYFDADGSVADPRTSNHGRGTIASVSRRLVEGLRELAVSCGLTITPIRTASRVTNYGSVRVSACVIAAGSMNELPLWHEAKAANQRSVSRVSRGLTAQYLGGVRLPDGFFARRVRAIEVSGAEPVYDLTVEHDSHSFIVEGVVTHNCWKETHQGEDVWVVRKGCTPAWPGQRGFVGATMGEPSVILEGIESDAGESLLYSTVHGAGRVMSRTQAAGKVRRFNVWECNDRDCDYRAPRDKQLEGGVRIPCPEHPDGRLLKRQVREQVCPGAIDWPAVTAGLSERRIELRGGGADEAPGAYKRLDAVLDYHADTIRILHTLTPLGVAMAGADVYDPFKD